MPLIILFGPDGSGKTTLASALIRELRKSGYNVSCIKMKSHHLMLYVLLKVLQKLNYVPKHHSPKVIDYSLRNIFKGGKIYLLLEFLNIMLWNLLFVKPRLWRGDVVVADRFSTDSIVSLHIISGDIPNIYKKTLLNLCRGSIAIYVRAKPSILLSRKTDEELSEIYLRYLLALYDEIAREVAFVAKSLLMVDTTELSRSQAIRIALEFTRKYL